METFTRTSSSGFNWKGYLIKFGLFLNVILVICTSMAYLSPMVDPEKYSSFAFFGLVFSVLMYCNVIAILTWLLLKPRYALISFLTLLIGFQSVQHVIGFNTSPKTKIDPFVTMGSFNLQFFKTIALAEGRKEKRLKKKLVRFLNNENDTEILCFQEFGKFPSRLIDSVLTHPYKHILPGKTTAIYSSYPILDSGEIDFNSNVVNNCIWADINVDKATIRVYNFHLESNQKDGKAPKEIVENAPESINSKVLFGIVKHYNQFTIKRLQQVKAIRQHTDKSPHPVVICGDMNDAPHSRTYTEIATDLNDAFLFSGKGIGGTHDISNTGLRIDYIFTDKSITPENFQIKAVPFSDHHFIRTDLQF